MEEMHDFDSLIVQAERLVERRSQEALVLAERIMFLAIAERNTKYIAQAKYLLAFYNCLVANDYDKAIAYCEDALQNARELEASGILHKTYMTLGNSYHLKGDVFSAEQCYMKGLKLLENQKELTRSEKGVLASFYYNLSLLLSSSQLGISSEEYLEKAIELYKEVENNFKLSKGYVAYAGFLGKKKEYVKAIEFLHKSLEIDEKLNDPYSISLSKANLGVLHLRINNHTLAFEYINSAMQFYESNKMTYEMAMVKTSLAEALFSSGKKDEGIDALLESEKLFVSLDNKQEMTRVYEMLSNYLKEKKDFERALEYHDKYTEGLKYFFDVEKTNALTRAKKEFESEQKEKEAGILREKNEEIKRYVTRLEQSNDQLKQFASVASHDLREPLRMISSYSGLLQKTLGAQLTQQQTDFMHFITDGAKRMDQMIIDLLRLAKVDANPRIEEINLNSVIEELKLNMGMLIKEKNALLVYPELPNISADRTMVVQLFQNIISNGIKYNESSIPTIITHVKNKDGKLEITIADNGIGIPENMREKAFQIFNRLPTKKDYPGTGIGLAICKKIVDSMDGAISIADNTGGGTAFTISLPANIIAA